MSSILVFLDVLHAVLLVAESLGWIVPVRINTHANMTHLKAVFQNLVRSANLVNNIRQFHLNTFQGFDQ